IDPWTTLMGGGLIAGLLFLAVILRRRAPLAALGILWFFAGHAITSNVVPLELAFEHRNYFALLGVLLVIAQAVRMIPVRHGPAIKAVAVCAVILTLGFLGAIRSATWGESLLLATEHAGISPRSPRALQDVGIVYYEMSGGVADSPFFSFAVKVFEQAGSLPSSSILPDQTLLLLGAQHGGVDVDA